ncbi:MAG: proline dehydrogenase family protein [Bacteroidetes bacterium]|nr:proline dehydrogenase family protein [Bacteroidota bacterium]
MLHSEVSFDNTERAFITKDTRELKRSLWLFKLMGSPLLVKLFSSLTLFAIKVGLPVRLPIKATIFKQFCGGESIEESKDVVKKLSQSHIGSILDYSVEGKESEEDFESTKNEILRIITLAKDNPAIPYTSVKLTGIARFGLLEKLNGRKKLSKEEEEEFQRLKKRLIEISSYAARSDVPVYFDAEESWIQDTIDMLTEEMMEMNNGKSAIVLTTLQMYRWDRIAYLQKLIEKAKSNKFSIGIKLVRGAYMEKENLRATKMGYKSPIQPSKEKTDSDFDKAVDICLENIDIITLCAGTHNEASAIHLIKKMAELNLANDHPHVYFSQLYGMSDHITYNLAESGYNVTKYLPYGPVKSVIPYLIRRAAENTAIAGQMSRELRLIIEEKNRRQYSRMLPVGKGTGKLF